MDRTEERIDRLERLVADLDGRVTQLEPRRRAAGSALAEPQPARSRPAAPQPARPRPAAPQPAPARPASAQPVSPRPAPPARSAGLPFDLTRDDLEDLVGGRVLAWVGGLAVLLGMVFLFALAVSNGWIGESARVALGAAGSAGLLALGIWLHESKARTDAALAAVATGISGLFLTVTVAAQVYELIPQVPAVLLAVAVGAIGTGLAVRWESRGIALLGIVGALLAPVLTGVAGDGGTMLILFVALASAAGVLLWQRWDWLALAAFVVATPQWIAYLVGGPPVASQLAVLVGFGALGAAVAVGHDVRLRARRLRCSSAYLLALSAIVVSAVGWGSLTVVAGEGAGNAWLAAMALVHIGIGLGGRALRLSDDLTLLALVLGTVIGDVAFGLIVDGPALTVGWALTGVGFTVLMRRRPRPTDAAEGVLTQVGLGGHVALAMLSAIAVSNPAQVLNGSAELTVSGAAAVAALAAACLVSARIAGERHDGWRIALDSLGLAAIAVLTALTLDGLELVLAWTLEVVALAGIARRTGDHVAAVGGIGFAALAAIHALVIEAPPEALMAGFAAPVEAAPALAAVGGSFLLLSAWTLPELPELRMVLRALAALTLLYLTAVELGGVQLAVAWTVEAAALATIARRTGDEVAAAGSLVFVGAAALHALVLDAPPLSLVTGLADPIGAVASLSGIAGCLMLIGTWAGDESPELATILKTIAAVALLYLASTIVVTPFESDSAVDSALLSAHQQGQMVLSVFWALVGVGTVVLGLRRDLGIVRVAGLALLGVAVAKVFLFDLATLRSLYRVVSFIGLGLLLLGGALVWQRLRPRALSDLRNTPAGVR